MVSPKWGLICAPMLTFFFLFTRKNKEISSFSFPVNDNMLQKNPDFGPIKPQPIEMKVKREVNAENQIIIVIPYRDRKAHYEKQMKHLSLHPQRSRMKVIVVEQTDLNLMRRGWLRNIGILESNASFNTCIVAHDVDLFVSYATDYAACEVPTCPCNYLNGKKYPTLAGGVLNLRLDSWVQVNGYTNLAYGWGGEDDCLFHRLSQTGLLTNGAVRRPTGKMYSCFLLDDENHTAREKKNHKKHTKQCSLVRNGGTAWKADGLNSIRYTVLSRSTDEHGSLWLKVSDANNERFVNLYDTRFINSKGHTESRALIENQFTLNQICCVKRIEAVDYTWKNQALSYASSHTKALESIRAPVGLIAEDEATFIRTPPIIELETPSFRWHVLFFAYRGELSDTDCVDAHGTRWCRVIKAHASSMYAVRKSYIPYLLQSFNESLSGILLERPDSKYGLGQTWSKLQYAKGHHWYAAVPRIAMSNRQSKGFF